MKRCAALLAAFAALGLAGCSGGITKELRQEDFDDAFASAALARMQTLAGKWKSDVTAEPKAEAPAAATPADAPAPAPTAAPAPAETIPVEYLVTAGGHALEQKLFAGTDREVVATYRLEGTDLVLGHDGTTGTRPHLKLDRKSSTRDDLRFAWDGHATDVDPKKDAHLHEGRVHFLDGDDVECEWALWVDGKEASRHSFTLRRTAGKYSR